MLLVLHMLFHMSLCSISHHLLCNTHFSCVLCREIYVYVCTHRCQRGYSNILRHWELSCCGVAGAEQEMWLEGGVCGNFKGRSRERTFLGLILAFSYCTSACTSLHTVPCPALPPATPYWRSSVSTATSLYHDMPFKELLL